MVNSTKSFALSNCRVGTAHQSRFCHCERSEAISLHHSLFLVLPSGMAKPRHSIFTTTFFFLLLLFLIAAPAQAEYGGGTGEPNDPYLIFDANQMNAIGADSNDWDKHFILMADIDLSTFTETDFNIIGERYYDGGWIENPFTGVFDGSGHTISNFSYTSTGTDYIGLFGYVGKSGANAEIRDLGLINPNVDAGTENCVVGSLVGRLGYGGTITNCYAEGGSVVGDENVGGLVGYNYGTITNCYSSGNVSGSLEVGGLVGDNWSGRIINCYSSGSVSGYSGVGGLVGYNSGGVISSCYSTSTVSGGHPAGGLVGYNRLGGDILNSYCTGSVSGDWYVGGLVGWNCDTITNCSCSGSVSGRGEDVGGLVGHNYGTVSTCYCRGNVSGNTEVGGLAGWNSGTIINCYSSTSVSGTSCVGGLVGQNGYYMLPGSWPGWIYNCYSTGSVLGTVYVGGLVGIHIAGEVGDSFWDIETSHCNSSAGGTGKTTAEMQTESTFTDAGWDFTTPVWIIDEGVDYPRLWWELVPVLHAEPEVTLGTTNTIFWDPVPGANDYYAECAEDANFTSILYNTGWITETSYEFTGLELGRRYWYSVKARNVAGVESGWSNVESSLQVTLADAVDMMLDPDTLKNKNMKNALLNKINVVQQMLDAGRYEEALNKLQNDILQKMNGCGEIGEPDKNDWIITCEGQSVLYPLIIEAIELLENLI